MLHSSTRKGAAAARAGLAALLLAGGVGAAQATHGLTAQAAAPRLAASSPKPDWRGADLGNSGMETTANGPVITPTQVFNANPGQGAGTIQGIELDGAGNVLFTKGDGFVYSYTPAGTQNFAVNAKSSFGADINGAASNPVASADGNIYISTDSGNLLKISAATGASTQFVNYGAAVQQTLKVDDATNNVFFGGQDHFINSFSKTGTNNYSTTGAGSTQDGTIAGCSGAVSGNPLFYGEGTLDSSDNFYIASYEPKTSGPRSCANTLFGTLYKVSPTGTILASKPLAGAAVGAVALVPNAAVAGGSELVVDTKLGYVEAYDTSLNRLWVVKTANAANNASVAVDASRNRVYVADTASALHALNLTTGAVDTTFNGTGTTNLTGGSSVSPIIDAGGNIYEVDSTGTLFKFDPTGATVYRFNTGIGTGFFSPAIATDGTIYVGGNVGQASGFNAAAVATATSTVASTATTTPTVAATSTTTPTVAATSTTTPTVAATSTTTPTVAATSTTTPTVASTATTTPTNTTAPTATSTNTTAPTATKTAVPATSTSTSTSTTAPTSTNTAVPATSTSTTAPTNTAVPTSTSTTAPTKTTAPTSTSTSTSTPTNTATSTGTPNATQTAVQQTAIAATATAAATTGVNLPNCQLIVLPNPKIVQRTGSEAVLFKVLPNAPITVTISASYVTTATLFTGAAGTPGVTINRNPDGTFTFTAGPNGRALIDFPIPADAPLGSVTVKAVATEFCNGGDPGQSNKTQPHTITRTSSFTVEAQQGSSFGLHEVQSLHRILFRTVQPVGAGSVVTDSIYINTAPNVPVTTTFTLNGATVYQNVSTSSANGSVRLKAPFSSTLLVPGKGGRLLETVQANVDGKILTFRSQKAIREVNLRLIVQVQETTRGNRRAPFEISNKANGSSKLTVLVLCDPNAAISGAASVGSFTNTQTATCGKGGRAKLTYSVPNSTSPTKGTGTVTVTSSYRGASKTRIVNFHYTHKFGKRA